MEQKNQISLVKAILMGMNIMVGAAILAAPQIITIAAGDMGIFAWGIALVFLPIVLSIMRLTQVMANNGGIYVYAQETLGRVIGFISGSLYYFGYTFAATAVISLLRVLLLTAFPDVYIIQNLYVYFALVVGLIATLNLISRPVMEKITFPAIFLKFSPLIIAILAFPFTSGHDFVIDLSQLQNLPGALPTAIFGFLGFEYSLALNRDLENKEVNAPRAVVGTFLATTTLYLLFHYGLLYMMGSQNLAALGATGFPGFLPIGSIAIKAAIVGLVGIAIKLSYLSSANGMTGGNVETLYGLAKDKLIRGSEFLTVTNQNDRPLFAGIFQFLMIFAFGTLVPNVLALASLTNLAVLLVFALLIISFCVILRKNGSLMDKVIATLGLSSTSGLIGYSFISLGATWSARFQSVMPLAGCVLLSMLAYQPKK